MLQPEFPRSIDSTMIGTYTECQQKFFIEYCLKLAPTGISPDLHAGGCLADGMETVRHEVYYNKTPLMIALGKGFEVMARRWGDYEPPHRHAKTFETTCFAMMEYFNEFPPDTDLIQPYYHSDGKPAVEFTFALPTEVRHPTDGNPLLYSGRCDMLGQYSDGQSGGNLINVVVDEKTTKGIGPKWHLQWGMRGQFHGYTYAVNQGGIECTHALVRAISLQTTQNKFASVLVPIPHFKQERWWQHTNQKIKELTHRWDHMVEMREIILNSMEEKDIIPYIQNATSHDVWTYAYGAACEAYGGCSFQGMCSRKYPAKWYDDYSRRVWDPLAKDPTAGSETEYANLPSVDLPPEAKAMLGIRSAD